MFDREKYVAITLIALLGMLGCSGESAGPTPVEKQFSVALVWPAEGADVNATVAPEKPVEFRWQFTNASSNATGTVVVDGADVCTGTTSCMAVVSDNMGGKTASWKVRGHSGGEAATSASRSFTVARNNADVNIQLPAEGVSYRADQTIPCSYTIDDPRGFGLAVGSFVDGLLAPCSGGRLVPPPQLVLGGSGDPAASWIGDHAHVIEVQNAERGIFAADTVHFTITSPPGLFVATLVGFDGSRDFAVWDEGDKTGAALVYLTNTKVEKTWPNISPDGTKIAWTQKTTDWCYELYVANVDGSGKQRLSGANCASGSTRAPYWSPDGTWLAYIGTWDFPDGLQKQEFAVYTASADGTIRQRLPTWTCHTYWSPAPCFSGTTPNVAVTSSGKSIITVLYESLANDNSRWRHVIVDFDVVNHGIQRIYSDSEGQLSGSLRPWVHDIVPDGSWVASRSFATSEVALLRIDGSSSSPVVLPVGSTEYGGIISCSMGFVCYVPSNKKNSLRRVRLDGTGDEEILYLPNIQAIETPRYRSR